ncbi:hypothetical protein Hanom_Chr04g00289691 [Helianthus anomalus]
MVFFLNVVKAILLFPLGGRRWLHFPQHLAEEEEQSPGLLVLFLAEAPGVWRTIRRV